MIDISNQQEFEAAAGRLNNLRATNPAQAILESRQIRGVGKFTSSVIGLRAAVFVDGGSARQDKEVVQEGITLFRELLRDSKDELHYRYNLANGLSASARLSIRPLADWYIDTREERREARTLLYSVIQHSVNTNLRAQAE